jgi:subfamily B ATP-binding cassette protein MsbA
MKRTVRRLWPYLRPFKKRLIQAVLVMIGVAILNGATVWILKPAIDNVFVARDLTKLYLIVVLIPILFLLKFIFSYALAYLLNYLTQKSIQQLREDLFRHLHALSMDFYWRSKSGDVLSRMTNDMMRLEDGIKNVPLYAVRDSGTVVVLMAAMFYIHWRFALLALLTLPMAGISLSILGKKLRSASRRSQEIMGDIYQKFHESLQGVLVIKAFNYEESAIGKFIVENDSFFQQIMRYNRANALSGPLMEFLGSLVLSALVYAGGREVISTAMTPGDFFTFIGSFFAAYMPLKNILQLTPTLQMGLASADRIFAILDEQPSVREKRSAAVLGSVSNGIEFRNVSFTYPERDQSAIKNIDLNIRQGEVLAIAGPSGSGKTTFVHLMLRLFDPTQGGIFIDGVDLRDFTFSSLRGHIGLVTQDTVLFNDTIAANIAVGRDGASREEIRSALRAADALDFVEKMPHGLDTPLGERGLKLSGGQRQRIAIARAVLKNPPILILDEATSNLDAESEHAVQQSLERLFPGRTVILIAHRLVTLQNASRVVVLHKGEIREVGTHAELLAKGGVYATLYKFQQLEPAA